MSTNVRSNRWAQVVAWFVAGLFLIGFFLNPIGNWTGPILGVWFVGTQKLRRGFVWMLAFAFVPTLLMSWRSFPLTGPEPALKYLFWMLLTAVLGVLPFTFHRLTSPRLPGLISTLPLPLAAAINHALIQPPLHTGTASGSGFHTFLVFWFAAVVIWMWNHEFERSEVAIGTSLCALLLAVAVGLERFPSSAAGLPLPASAFAWSCVVAAVALSICAAFNPGKQPSWAEKPETEALLQSPFTGAPLRVVTENGREALVSSSGERFPIRNGIPSFVKPGDLTGDNGKYNHLYETIGGFYDDTQRFFGAFRGISLDSYFENYMRLLDVKPGDSVLETSVGTGLNFKYLPRGVKLSGLDLSPEMLTNCQANMRRWGMDANLYLGNAESLPFADSSFDVVFTAGAINFFNDRAKAIREMIRVAKPGSLLMIEDETEEYVKSTYEKIPYTSSFYGDRKHPVTVPVDLVPPEMEDVRVEMLKEGKFYAITFRKPAHAVATVRLKMGA
ncbi:MAG: class I SAM-dependent methyltransferase [Terracidiphilus sp.]